jgi:uncharacterized protein YrrD
MRLKEIRGLPVVDPTAARKIGTVTDYLVDPASGRIAALAVDGGDSDRIPAHRVRRIGRHAVVLTATSTSRSLATNGSAAYHDNERWLDAGSLANLEVLGDDGNRIGRLSDAAFDQDTLDIQAYLLRSSFWARFGRRRGRIQPSTVASCSRELMIVTTGRLGESQEVVTSLADDEPTTSLGVPLKLEDRLPAPSLHEKVEDGHTVPALGRSD